MKKISRKSRKSRASDQAAQILLNPSAGSLSEDNKDEAREGNEFVTPESSRKPRGTRSSYPWTTDVVVGPSSKSNIYIYFFLLQSLDSLVDYKLKLSMKKGIFMHRPNYHNRTTR